jgi:carbamoyl-phosphate synthase large subunit
MKKKILFTGGGGSGSEALWRILSAKYELYFADASVDAIDDTIPDERKIAIPFADADDFIAELSRICADKKIDLIVPGVDEELVIISENRARMPEVFSPSTEFVKLMLDKLACAQAIEKAGLSVPKTLPVTQAKEIGFPLIVKPKSGRGSRGVCVLGSMAEIDAYKAFYKTSDDKLIAQALGIGDEYTVLVAGDKLGRLLAVIPVKVGQKKGITIRAKTDMNQQVIEYAKKFHAHFKPNAIYNIQCILTKQGTVLPFEVNPRVSTTFCLGVASGFDPFADLSDASNVKVFLPEKQYSLKRNWFNNITEA